MILLVVKVVSRLRRSCTCKTSSIRTSGPQEA